MATTEASTETEPGVEVEADFPPHRISVGLFERMIDSGLFGDKSPVFLWHGRLVEKMTPGRPHVFAVTKLSRMFIRLLPDGWYSLQEQPIVVGDENMPEPDLTIARGSISDYLQRRPSPADIGLLVEVADSTLAIGSRITLRTYARAGIPIYWIVNLRDGWIDVFSDPEGESYKERQRYGPDDEVPVVLDGREVGRIPAREVLP